jgi:glycerophosphoryl diester phosphodiesterase
MPWVHIVDMSKISRRAALALSAAAMIKIHPALEARATRRRAIPIVIGHRGCSGERPEHTLASYSLAMDQGADYIEPDLVMTKDGILVARHENEISGTTDVAARPEFANRKSTKIIDGEKFTGWFTEDFTLAELKTLRARERLPELRPQNTQFDGQFEIPTFDEVIALANRESARLKKRIGIYPETKHPSYHASVGLVMEEELIKHVRRGGYSTRRDPIFIQSFEVGNLKKMRGLTDIRLIQLISKEGGPADEAAAQTPGSYANMITPDGLKSIAAYADGVGVEKRLVIEPDAAAPTALVRDAHAAGLAVHIWTLRRENIFLPPSLRSSENPGQIGDVAKEILRFVQAGVDGLFADNVAEAVAALRRQDHAPKRRLIS